MVAEERRAEIIGVAEKLFYERGYDNTSVAEIIEAAGIAKGTFYHHFASKSDLVEALIIERMAALRPLYDEIAASGDLDPVARLQRYFEVSASWKSANVELMVSTVMAMYREENALILRRMFENTTELLAPYLNEAIRDGVEAGVFEVPHPKRFGEFLLALFIGVGVTQGRLIAESLEEPNRLYDYAEMIDLLEHAVNRLLALPEGTIDLGTEGVLEHIKDYLEQRGA